ncbi:MAG: hypothetical protein Q9M97_02630 [Candidatus Gracilibacteria bacterium]|nr:hypothetical protein [Candidatus Gracilibacteria bacterium]
MIELLECDMIKIMTELYLIFNDDIVGQEVLNVNTDGNLKYLYLYSKNVSNSGISTIMRGL